MGVTQNLPLVRERRAAILAGNPERAAKQRDAGKLTARERVAALLDEASFVELDALAADGASGVVVGYGLIEGRPVYLYAQDFTVKAGAVGAEHARKVLKILDLAEKTGSPVIAMLDTAGARIDEGMAAVDAYVRWIARSSELSGVVPQVALVLGPCGGSAAICASVCDVVLMSQNGKLFVNGPQLVSAATGSDVNLEAIAGAEASAKSGAAHVSLGADAETIEFARKLISMLPGNNLEDSPFDLDGEDAPGGEPEGFDSIDAVSDMRAVMAHVADRGEAIELSGAFAPEMTTSLARVGGSTVGFIGTQPSADGGRLTADGCRKAARFARFLDCFSIPIVVFADTEGAAVNSAPQGDLMRACAQLMYALAEATSPVVSLVTGNAIGVGAAALCSRASADAVYAWPGSVISPMGAPAAVQILYKEELRSAGDPVARRAELEEKYRSNVADGVNAAKAGLVDDVIEPKDTRKAVVAALNMLAGKRESKPSKKHGNLPL